MLCSVHCLVADRRLGAAKLARLHETSPKRGGPTFGPVRGMILSSLASRRWSVLRPRLRHEVDDVYVFVGFMVLGLGVGLWHAAVARRQVGAGEVVRRRHDPGGLLDLLLVALVAYIVSWMGFLTHAQQFEDAFAPVSDVRQRRVGVGQRPPDQQVRGRPSTT